jgi:DNA processing protein
MGEAPPFHYLLGERWIRTHPMVESAVSRYTDSPMDGSTRTKIPAGNLPNRTQPAHRSGLNERPDSMNYHGAMTMDMGAKPDHDSARRYEAPATWERASVPTLLMGSPREDLSAKQMDLLANVVPKEQDGVFVSGDITLLKQRCISVVGARKVSPEGAARARRLARELAASGVVVVSGLAEGVDTEAMTAAIGEGGRVVGVIGTPLDKAYPRGNERLQEQVYRDHLLVSPFGHGSKVYKTNFPLRNRLMAALSDATVVIEASDTSGTLHQAAECQRLGRWLFIARSVANDASLEWPKKFLAYPRCKVLDRTEDMLAAVYGA